jgi:hypothetical protein
MDSPSVGCDQKTMTIVVYRKKYTEEEDEKEENIPKPKLMISKQTIITKI